MELPPQLEALYAAQDEVPGGVNCTNYPDAFFPEGTVAGYTEMVANAKSLCADCPIKAMCAEYGLKNTRFGIWGGLTEHELKALRNRLKIVLPPSHLDAA